MRIVTVLLVGAAFILSGFPAGAQTPTEAAIPEMVDVAGDWEVVEDRAWTTGELAGLDGLAGLRRIWLSDDRQIIVSYVAGFPFTRHRTEYLEGGARFAGEQGWIPVTVDAGVVAYEVGGDQVSVWTQFGPGVAFVSAVGENRQEVVGQVLAQLRAAEPTDTLKTDPLEMSYTVGLWAGRILVPLGVFALIVRVRRRKRSRPDVESATRKKVKGAHRR